jgi:hypothetical protein
MPFGCAGEAKPRHEDLPSAGGEIKAPDEVEAEGGVDLHKLS